MCRCLTTEVVDEEAVYKEANYRLAEEGDMIKQLLSAQNEKLVCFDDLKRELEQKKNDLKKTDDDRKALH